MKLSWVQAVALYNVACGRLPWEKIRRSYKSPLTTDALKRKGLLRQDRGGWYDLTKRGNRWVKEHPPDPQIRASFDLPEQMPQTEVL